MKNGGYAIISHDDINIFNKVDSAYNAGKPILFYDDDKTCFFVDSVKLNGDGDYEFTKGGKTWTVTDNNTLSSEGSVINPTMENIKDLAGNLRFIEGEGTPTEIEGVTPTYCKWSLSGTHLMLVYAGNVANTTTISTSQLIVSFELPKYIFDKIYPVFATNRLIYDNLTLYADNWSTQTLGYTIDKGTYAMQLISQTSLTLTANRAFRFQFDLLIDAE